MAVQKRATNPPRFSELLNLFPCPAWIEDFSGQILIRNARFRPAKNRRSLKTVIHPLPLAGGAQTLRLVALLPAGQEADCQHHIISALLALLLDVPRPDEHPLTPRQRDTYYKLSLDIDNKTIASDLGITHNALLVRIARLRKRLGEGKIPRQRRPVARKAVNPPKPACN